MEKNRHLEDIIDGFKDKVSSNMLQIVVVM